MVPAFCSYSVQCWSNLFSHSESTTKNEPENIIIVAGPKEPSCNDLNPYLEYMVDDLLKLWNGVEIQIPSSNFSSKILRAALVYISSDLPATRKICGFLVLKQTMVP